MSLSYYHDLNYRQWLDSDELHRATVAVHGAPVPVGGETELAAILAKAGDLTLKQRVLIPEGRSPNYFRYAAAQLDGRQICMTEPRIVDDISRGEIGLHRLRFTVLGALRYLACIEDGGSASPCHVADLGWRQVLIQALYGAALGISDPMPDAVVLAELALDDRGLSEAVQRALDLSTSHRIHHCNSIGYFWLKGETTASTLRAA